MAEEYMVELFLDLIEDLRNNVLTELREQVELLLVETYTRTRGRSELMQNVVQKVLPQKHMIKDRNINYFSDNRDLFDGLPEDRVHYYGEVIMNSGRLSPDDISVLWDYLDQIIETAEEYKKNV